MRTLFLFVLCILLTILLTPLLLFCLLFGCRTPLMLAGKGAMHLFRWILGIKVSVSGREHIRKNESYIFMSNHLSFLDGPLLFMLIPQPVRVILKKEIFKLPVIGLGMKHVGFVPVDRRGIRGGKKSIDQAAGLIRDKGYSFLIFPEGTRSRDGEIQAFKRGGFFLALESNAPIVPISIDGSYELMPKGTFFVKKGTVRVVFHPPQPVLDFSLTTMPELIKKVKRMIQSCLEG